MLGVLDLGDPAVETPEVVAERHPRRPARTSPPSGWSLAPDCGMKYLPREIAFGKLRAMVAGAAIVRARAELDGR